MDRIFGNPVQAPLVPGQFAQAPFAQAQNLPNPPLNVGQGPVVINYHIQYQQQRQQLQPVQQPQQLQPAPQFRGFQGPGGEWQAWGDARPPNAAQNIPQPTIRQQDIVVPTPTVPVEPPTTSQPGPAASTESSSVQEAGDPADPREAAALAALRRFNVGPVRPTPVSRTSSSAASGSNRISPPPAESSSSSVTSHAPQSNVTPNGTVPGVHIRPEIPSLIPLYDYNTIGTQGIQSNGPVRPSFPRAPSAPSYPSPQVQPTSASRASALRAAAEARRVPLPQLPPTMTDEQLAVMDRLTREAIDERLRVLEGVSGAVYRCIDELMRMRSALPQPVPIPAPAVNTTAASPTAPTSDSEELPGLGVQPPTTPQKSVASGSKSEDQADEQDGDSSGSSDCSFSNEEENGAL